MLWVFVSYCENFVASHRLSTSIIWIFNEPNTLDLMSCSMVVYNQQQTFFCHKSSDVPAGRPTQRMEWMARYKLQRLEWYVRITESWI